MRVAIDARMINSSGIGTVIQNLIKQDLFEIVIGNKNILKNYDSHFKILIEFDAPIHSIKEQLIYPFKALKIYNPDLLFVPHYNIPLLYHGKMVTMIHDLTHLVHEEFLPNKFLKYYVRFMIGIAVRKSERIITVSECTKKDLLGLFFKASPERVDVVYNGIGDEFVNKPKSEVVYLKEKYRIPDDKTVLLFVGNLKKHKNIYVILKALSVINDRDKFRLLLVGKAFEHQIDLNEKEKELGIESIVIHTGIVSQEELVDLYNLADLMIFPSIYEGFGLPVAEALKCGTSVVCSNTSSIPEVGLDMVTYFSPYDYEKLASIIDSNDFFISSDTPKFTWEKSAKGIKECFIKSIS